MSNRRAAIVWSPGYECDIGPHVFPMEKFRLVRNRLLAEGEIVPGDLVEPATATRDELLLAHTAEYLDDLDVLRWTPRTMMSELPLTAGIVNAYALAAGGTTLAAREALARGFAANLGGGFHHAFADRAEGFCYLNDLAVAARAVIADRAVARVAVVDLDVHQGNGTARIFEGDPAVFTLSIHQERNYPMPKMRSDLDVGLDDGTDDAGYLSALDAALARVWSFAPELVLYQAGADPYRDDQLGGLALTIDGLELRDRRVLEGCAERGIAAVVTLGGGYARRVDDTVEIHTRTCRLAARLAASGAGAERRA
jgi:acetoin utilization deacetylase AcuC-like enzyme